jgi:hypothetical protein
MVFFFEMANELPVAIKNSFKIIPETTAIRPLIEF